MFQQDAIDGIFIKVNGFSTKTVVVISPLLIALRTSSGRDKVRVRLLIITFILVHVNSGKSPYIAESVLAVFNKDTSFPMVSGRTGTCTVMDEDDLHLG